MWSEKLKASFVHFCICILVAIAVLSLVYFAWYEGVLSKTQGIANILLIVLAVDVTLGPLLTFIVYKKQKKTLKFDLSVIALIQVVFLAYGLYVIEFARPVFIVFVKDRFEVVARADWSTEAAKNASPVVKAGWLGPRLLAADSPTDPQERSEFVLSSVSGGPDLHQLPKYYIAFDGEMRKEAAQRALAISELERLNPSKLADIRAAIAQLGIASNELGFLPLKGKDSDATAVLKKSTGEVLAYWPFAPWE